jgi:hypothetical protein
MASLPSTVERAYQLARSGQCPTINDIKIRLRAEGCPQIAAHLAGLTIQRALRDLCAAAVLERPRPAAPEPAASLAAAK